MTDPSPTPDLPAAVTGWIIRINHLRDDVAFGLDPRGVAATLGDLLVDMQDARRRAGQ